MKKLLLTLLLAAVCWGVRAQSSSAYNPNTTFCSFNVGAVFYQHSGSSQLGVPAAGFYLGRWIMRPLAFRLASDVAMVPSYHQSGTSGTSLFLQGSAEFMWDVNASFFHVYNKNLLYPVPVYPLFGMGFTFRPALGNAASEKDFHAMLGLHFPVRIASRWDAFLEYKCFFFPQTFDGSASGNRMHNATVGITHRWSDNPFFRRTEFESRSSAEDWFVGLGLGPNFSSFAFENWDKIGMYSLAPEVIVGRNFSNFWTIRLELNGLIGHAPYDKVNDQAGESYTFTNLHLDVMTNLANLFGFTRGRRLGVMPYIGAGLIWRYDNVRFDMAADAGLAFRYYLSKRSDIYLDCKYIMVPPRLAGASNLGYSFLTALPSVTVGYIYNLGHSTTRYRTPTTWSPGR